MSSKRRLGTALHLVSGSGNLFLRAEGIVRIGETVLDSRGRKVGVVFNLFFPVSAQSVADDPERDVGDPFFLGMTKG